MKSTRLSLGATALLALFAMLTANAASAAIVYSQNFETVPTTGGPPAAALITTSNAGASVDHPNNVNFSSIVANTSPNFIQAVVDADETFGAGATNQYMRYVDGGTTDPRAIAPAPLPAGTGGFQLTFDIVDPVTAQTGTARVLLGASNLANESVILFFTDGTLQAFHGSVVQTKADAYTTGVKHTITVVGNYGDSTINYGLGNSQSVAPGRYDTWVDNVLHPELDDALFRNVVTSTTHFVVNSSNGALSSLNLDNIEVQDSITTMIPEPGTAILAGFGLIVLGVCQLRKRS